MAFRGTQLESRQRYLSTYDVDEAAVYDGWVTALTDEDQDACLADIGRSFEFAGNSKVLDAGAGTGALCLALIRIAGLEITALEPCAEMGKLLAAKTELSDVKLVEGFCDHHDDRSHFTEGAFDVIASRQLANCLFDPIAAFRNWHFWLRDHGTVIVMDGMFDRDAWCGRWEGMVDTLPLSACRTTAMLPYLLEHVGFRINFVGQMESTNKLPLTRTPRYIVTATKVSPR